MAIELEPIGWVVSTLTDRRLAPRQGDEGAPDAWIELGARFLAGARDLQPGSDLLLLTWLDQGRRDLLRVHARGDRSTQPIGVFSTRSPDRPNPIGLHRVRLLGVEHERLHVEPLEALNGTPVLDIKPVLGDER